MDMTQEVYTEYKNRYEKILITNKIFKESFDNKKILKNKKDIYYINLKKHNFI